MDGFKDTNKTYIKNNKLLEVKSFLLKVDLVHYKVFIDAIKMIIILIIIIIIVIIITLLL